MKKNNIKENIIFLRNKTPDLNLESEVFLEVFDDHHEKGQLDAERFRWVDRAGNVGRAEKY